MALHICGSVSRNNSILFSILPADQWVGLIANNSGGRYGADDEVFVDLSALDTASRFVAPDDPVAMRTLLAWNLYRMLLAHRHHRYKGYDALAIPLERSPVRDSRFCFLVESFI